MSTPTTILSVQSSGRRNGSTTRTLSDRVIETLGAGNVVTRDLSHGVPFVDENWIAANFTPEEQRTAEQAATLAFSDSLVEELEAADVIVIGAPIYNFGVPAALKAWIDMVARARRTFRYTDNGPDGLLKNKRAIVVAASSGTEVGSSIDFATGYLRHVLGFIGVTDVTVIAADRQMVDADAAIARAMAALEGLAPAA